MRAPTFTALACAAALAGCVNLAPSFERPAAPVADAWPGGSTAPAASTTAADIPWRDFITDNRLRQVVEVGLANNRDLRIAVLNIERARALYRIDRAGLLPQVDLSAAASRQRTAGGTGTQYSVDLGVAGYELDFFGRVRNLSDSSLQSFFAVEANRRSTQISLVAEIASAWLTLAADAERLALARDTLQSQQTSFGLTKRTRELGGTSGLVLARAQTTVDSARVDVARYTALIAQDRNALELLAGARLADALLPLTPPANGNSNNNGNGNANAGAKTNGNANTNVGGPALVASDAAPASLLLDVPAGLPSEVLLRRPDVLAAEYVLRAANANIGVARAALFPSIRLTASAGVQSNSLADLFKSGSGVWSFVPQLDLPIFDAGRRRANVVVSETQQAIEVASYERTLQQAFREVADALAARSTLADQQAAQQSLLEATRKSYTLSDALFKNGASSYLDVLDAQRSLYAAQQGAITLRLAEQSNRITLYRVLGGGFDAPAANPETP